MNDEIDLFGEDGDKLSDAEFGKQVRSFRHRLAVKSETNSLENSNRQREGISPLQDLRTVIGFNDFNRKVYCNVSNVSLVLTQMVRDDGPQLGGSYDLYFHQDCTSRWNAGEANYDWYFNVKLWNSTVQKPENLLISTSCGWWVHGCGKMDAHSSGQWVDGTIRGQDIRSWQTGLLTWTSLSSVLGC
ncbi:hypothetical protein NKI38_04555 [Mesorhizobium sp. M0621]|uniref:hypothetical protein n=1 Tax=Mesorhizobium sp. M0621 TaxID=2956974 RepID=UPI00333552B8